MLRDVSFDLQRAPWVVTENAALGIRANMVLPIWITGLICTITYALPQTSMLGAILLTGFVRGAAVIRLRLNGDLFDIGENILIGVLAWAGLRCAMPEFEDCFRSGETRFHNRQKAS